MSDGLLVPPCSQVALGPGEGVQLVRPQLGGGQQGPPPAGGGHHLLILYYCYLNCIVYCIIVIYIVIYIISIA